MGLIGVTFLFGCAHTPLPTATLVSKAGTVKSEINNLHYTFIDARDEQFKTEGNIMINAIPTIGAAGDALFDEPLSSSFQKMFLARFPDVPEGYNAEIKLIKFHATSKANELSMLPVINFLTLLMDSEYHGISEIDVAILDKNGKFIFTKSYRADIKEMKPLDNEPCENDFDILAKAFSKVTDEFETDVKRINFDDKRL